MPDIADDHAAFREAMRRAEEASGIQRDEQGTELNGIEAILRGETPDVTPELEGAVPVQASDQPLETEPVVEEAVDTSEQQQEAPEAAVDDPLKKIAELEARLAEKDSFIGRQSTEIGELRSAVEEIRQHQAQPVEPQAPAVPITQELIDSDPQRATLLAFSQGNQAALEIAFEQWREYDPFTAGQWLTDQRLAEQRRELEAKLEQTQKTLEEKTAPLVARDEEQLQTVAWAQAFDKAKEGRPDFVESAERLLAEVAPQHPSLLPLLQSTDPQVKADALVALYAIDKAGNPAALAAQVAEGAQEAAAEAEAARLAGSVVSGQTTAGQADVEKSDEELEIERYKARQGGKPSLARGWTGRS